MTGDNMIEKVGLLALAGISIGALSTVAFLSLSAGTLDPNAATLLGAIVAVLGAFAKDIIQAIRGFSMSAQLTKVTDQLAASGPAAAPPADEPAPQETQP